jgi:hypothetical protein
MDAETPSRVRDRAGNRCEYCRIHQRHYTITFHVEHIVARQHHGSDDDANLALACHACNRHKGPNLAAMDPETGELTRLFTPRTDNWNHHFRIQAGRIIGLTPVGRTTVYVLNMNPPDRVRTRVELEPETFMA